MVRADIVVLCLIAGCVACGAGQRRTPRAAQSVVEHGPPFESQPVLDPPARALTEAVVLQRAKAQLEANRHSGALEELGGLFTVAPDHLEGRVLEAMIHDRAGAKAAAIRAWERVERIVVVKGKIVPFVLKQTLLGAAEHYLRNGRSERGQLFLEELWRRFTGSEAAARGQFMVAEIALGTGRWSSVAGACDRLRRVRPMHTLNRRCSALTHAARRLLRVGKAPGVKAPRWEWEAPTPQGNDLHGVWVAPGGQAFIVGDAGTIVEFDARGRTSVVPPLTRWPLYGVFGRGGVVYAVGGAGAVLVRQAGSWTLLRAPSPELPDLYGVWVDPVGVMTAVGDAGALVRREGERWLSSKVGNLPLYGVWGSAANEVFAVGDEGTFLRFDGRGWSAIKSDAYESLRGIWGASSQQVLIAGARRTIVRFDGKRAVESVEGLTDFASIWGSPRGRAWAVGRLGSIIASGARLQGPWRSEPSGTGNDLHAVSGASGRVFAAGDGGTILVRRGQRWKLAAGGVKQTLVMVSARATQGETVALGERGRIVVRHRGRWHQVEAAPAGRYHGGWSDGRRLIAVGAGGAIVSGPLDGPRSIVSPTPYDLLAAVGCGAEGLLVGERGVVVRLEGQRAVQERPPSGHTLRAVAGCRTPLAVGDRGTLLRRQGQRWVREPTRVLEDLLAVWTAESGDEAFAVGRGGTVLHRHRGRWRALPGVPLAGDLVAVWGRSSREVYVASAHGQIMAYDGTSWTLHAAPTACLKAIDGNASEVIAVGCSGAVIRLGRGNAAERGGAGPRAASR